MSPDTSSTGVGLAGYAVLEFPASREPGYGASSFDRFWPSSADRTVLMEGESVASRSCSIACLVDINTQSRLFALFATTAPQWRKVAVVFSAVWPNLNATAVVNCAIPPSRRRRIVGPRDPARLWTTGDPSRHSHSIRLTPRAAVAPGQSNAHDASILSAMEPSPRLDHLRERHGPRNASRAELMRTGHQTAAHNRWLAAELQDALDDPRPSLSLKWAWPPLTLRSTRSRRSPPSILLRLNRFLSRALRRR